MKKFAVGGITFLAVGFDYKVTAEDEDAARALVLRMLERRAWPDCAVVNEHCIDCVQEVKE